MRQGKIAGGRAQRRHQRLRGDRRLRQGELQPDRLLQHAQGAGDHPAQRRRPAHRASRSGWRPAIPTDFESFDELFAAYRAPARATSSTSRCAATTSSSGSTPTYMPAPFLSLLIDDCIATGKDYHDGGARYNTTYIQGVGLGTMTDALTRHQAPRLRPEDAVHGRAAGRPWRDDFAGHERAAPAAAEPDAPSTATTTTTPTT